jgi:hypothetical protein
LALLGRLSRERLDAFVMQASEKPGWFYQRLRLAGQIDSGSKGSEFHLT